MSDLDELNVFDCRARWELATLLVALVLVPGATAAAEGSVVGRPTSGSAAPARRGGRGQPVRPPRSC